MCVRASVRVSCVCSYLSLLFCFLLWYSYTVLEVPTDSSNQTVAQAVSRITTTTTTAAAGKRLSPSEIQRRHDDVNHPQSIHDPKQQIISTTWHLSRVARPPYDSYSLLARRLRLATTEAGENNTTVSKES